MQEEKIFTIPELKDFVHEHIQQKFDNGEIELVGFDLTDKDNFDREYSIYETTLLEGLVNGIIMCGGKVEGIEI